MVWRAFLLFGKNRDKPLARPSKKLEKGEDQQMHRKIISSRFYNYFSKLVRSNEGTILKT